MQRHKPLIRKALNQALIDMRPIFMELRIELGERLGRNPEIYVVSGTYLTKSKQSKLNAKLNINTSDGQNKWYKNNEKTTEERTKEWNKKYYAKKRLR